MMIGVAFGHYKYEYKCISQDDSVVAEGELILELPCTIRNSMIEPRGIFAILVHERERLSNYRGQNHLKDIQMKVTNIFTGSVRYFGKEIDA